MPVIVLAVLATVFGLISLGASRLIAPRRPSDAKSAPYECGIVPSRQPPERFPVSFYMVAMLFIMFDIEIIFVFPYAIARADIGWFGFWALAEFSAVFFLAIVYVVARGGIDWGPLERSTRVDTAEFGMVSPERTARTTVRRVGLVGRPGETDEAA